MPLFVGVSVQQNEYGVIPDHRIEVDGVTVPEQSHPLFINQDIPKLGMFEEVWQPKFVGNGNSGYISPCDGGDPDQAIWWSIEDGRLMVRIGGRLLTFGLAHINQPSAPSTPEIGGEG